MSHYSLGPSSCDLSPSWTVETNFLILFGANQGCAYGPPTQKTDYEEGSIYLMPTCGSDSDYSK